MKIVFTNNALAIKDSLERITDIGELRAIEEFALRLRLKLQDNYFNELSGNRFLFK